MELKTVDEDERGVDVYQIRRQLEMTVEERVCHMVEVANTLMDIRAYAHVVEVPGAR